MAKSRRAAFHFLVSASFLLVAAGFSTARAQTPPKKPAAGPPAPLSTHYPILLLALGSDPSWSLRIGQKGPERLDRPAYPPITLEPAEVTREGTADSWTYHAKDTGTGATLSVHLTRETCTDPASSTKYNFRAVVDHAQLGTLNGCARIAAELFPKIVNPANQTSDDDDLDKKKPPAEIIPNFKPPVALAYLNSAGKIVVSFGAVKKIAATEGSELALSHDGKKLLYTRSDSKTGPDRTIVLYEFNTGLSHDLVHGLVRRAFWSPDDTRIAFLKSQDQKWQIWTFPAAAPESAAPFYTNDVAALHGWVDAHTVLASDMQNLYWISDDSRPIQTLVLKDLYGPAFQVMSSDLIRVNSANSDLLLVSADYQTPPKGAPKDSMDLAAGFFLYEVRSKRRVVLSPPDQWARGGEWSGDGVQIFYTRRLAANSFSTFRIFWDGTGAAPGQRRFMDGTDLVVGK
ncbi:MAG: TolB family protein [Candidatus Acidiferrales bacterium]